MINVTSVSYFSRDKPVINVLGVIWQILWNILFSKQPESTVFLFLFPTVLLTTVEYVSYNTRGLFEVKQTVSHLHYQGLTGYEFGGRAYLCACTRKIEALLSLIHIFSHTAMVVKYAKHKIVWEKLLSKIPRIGKCLGRNWKTCL